MASGRFLDSRCATDQTPELESRTTDLYVMMTSSREDSMQVDQHCHSSCPYSIASVEEWRTRSYEIGRRRWS